MDLQAGSCCLSDLSPGQAGQVVALRGALDVRQRLREMGLTVGTRIDIIRRAPLGDPLDVCVRGYHLSIRTSEARCIAMSPLTESDSSHDR